MGSRQEFDLTERLIQPNMTDEETAKYWQAKNAKVVVIKHGMNGSTAYLNNGESYQSSLSLLSQEKVLAEVMATPLDSYMAFIKNGL